MERRLIPEEVYENLPPMLSELCSYYKGRDRDMFLLSSLGVIGSCLPNIFGKYDGKDIYPNLYMLIIAPPASGKGAMMKPKSLINSIDKKLEKESELINNRCKQEKQNNKKGNKDENDFFDCPSIVKKLYPADSSSAKFNSSLANADHGLLILESEADTMGKMFSDSWGNYSDLLRKAFHHETVSVARSGNDLFITIEEPKLSIVMSGTPGQMEPIIKSPENGLFSRFLIYSFDEVKEFKKDLFEPKEMLDDGLSKASEILYNNYGNLRNRKTKIRFGYTESQNVSFINTMSSIQEDIEKEFTADFLPNLYRHSLICFRIAMILTAIRKLNNVNEFDDLICEDVDFENSIGLTKALLRHSQYAFEMMTIQHLSIEERRTLYLLPKEFERNHAIKIGADLGIATRTMDSKLQKWCRSKILISLKKGEYKKTYN